MLDDLYNQQKNFFYTSTPEEPVSERRGLWMNLSYDSSGPGFEGAVKFLMSQHKFPGHGRNVKKCLKCILINVRRLARSNDDSLIYRRGHEFYSKICADKHLNPLRITKTLVPIIDVLIREGYLEGETGSFSTYWKSQCSKVVPLEKMERLLDEYGLLSAKIEKSTLVPLIIVRNKKKEIIPHMSYAAPRLEKRVSKINALLRETDIRLADGALASTGESLDNISLYRVFNNGSLDDGGRFYGGFWQNLPSDLRPQILINGEETEELDFAGQHIGMLYALLGHEIPDNMRRDPYKIKNESIPRPLIKAAILCALNSDEPVKAKMATWKKFIKKRESDETPEELEDKKFLRSFIKTYSEFQELIEDILETHPLLRKGLFRGMGVKLQRMDSDVADHILYTLAQKGIPALPVHDSFIVQKKFKQELLAAMKAAYLESSNPMLQRAYTSIKDAQKNTYTFVD